MKNSLVFCFCFLLTFLHGQVIPPERLGNWLEVGADKNSQEFTREINVSTLGLSGSENMTVGKEFNRILESYRFIPVIFYFPAGTYVFEEPIRLFNNKIIMGDGPETIFRFLDLGNRSLFEVFGETETDVITLKYDLPKNSMSSVLNFGPLWDEGDLLYIFQDDEDKVTSGWAKNTTGNIAIVDEIEGNNLFFQEGTNQEFEVEKYARISRIHAIENVGIEKIRIEPTVETPDQSSNIYFRNAYNCWVSCVESYNTTYSHVLIDKSRNISVTGSYFQDGFNYGGGGRAYGTTLQSASKFCLIEDNVFNHLRHSILLQSGANNNVIGYNYSKDPYWETLFLPSNAAGDIVLHGNFPFDNLIEGNVCQNIVIDDSHGINGKYNTFFRNRTESYGIFMNNGVPTNDQNIVGNLIIRNTEQPIVPLYALAGSGHFTFANHYLGIVLPDNTAQLADSTYYLPSYSDLKERMKGVELIGLPFGLETEFNLAKERFVIDGMKTACGNPTSSTHNFITEDLIEVFPNPSPEGQLNLSNPSEKNRSYAIQNVLGATMSRGVLPAGNSSFDCSNFESGIYFIQIKEDNQLIQTLKWIR